VVELENQLLSDNANEAFGSLFLLDKQIRIDDESLNIYALLSFRASRDRTNLEDTHIPIAERVVKLAYLMVIAYTFCIHLGWEIERRMEHIPMRKHEYRAKSLFRKGMDSLRKYFHRKYKLVYNNTKKIIG
jgi:hypothetical protein